MNTTTTVNRCTLLRRYADDAVRGLVTPKRAEIFLVRACSCGACEHARQLDTRDAGDLEDDTNPAWGLE